MAGPDASGERVVQRVVRADLPDGRNVAPRNVHAQEQVDGVLLLRVCTGEREREKILKNQAKKTPINDTSQYRILVDKSVIQTLAGDRGVTWREREEREKGKRLN